MTYEVQNTIYHKPPANTMLKEKTLQTLVYSHKPEANKYGHYYITMIWKFSPIVRNKE